MAPSVGRFLSRLVVVEVAGSLRSDDPQIELLLLLHFAQTERSTSQGLHVLPSLHAISSSFCMDARARPA
jgi:hypothetical protein